MEYVIGFLALGFLGVGCVLKSYEMIKNIILKILSVIKKKKSDH